MTINILSTLEEPETDFVRNEGCFKDVKHSFMLKALPDQDFTIRPFTQKDRDEICEILTQTGWAPRFIEGQRKAIEKLTLDEEGDVSIAVRGENILGYIQVQHLRWNNLSYIHGLVISPTCRRQGIARALMAHVEKETKAWGNQGVFVDTPVDNQRARALYLATGYAEAYIMPSYYEDDLDGITYLKLFEENKAYTS